MILTRHLQSWLNLNLSGKRVEMNKPEKNILIVDDTPANIQLLSGVLKETYKVKAATSGEKGLKIA